MKLIENGSFPIADIQVGERLRQVDKDWAQGLAAMISETGLQHPVQIMKVGNSYRLIAGAHRLAAFQTLGRSDIPAMVYEPETENTDLEIRLHEIVENIGRRELTALDRAAHIAELKDVYLVLHGEKRGGDQKSKSKVQKLHFWSLGDEVASKMGLSKRTIFADAELYSKLHPDVRQALAATKFADARSQLVALSQLDAKDQKAVLKLITGDTPKAGTVGEALIQHFNRVDTKNPDDQAYTKFMKLWAVASRKAKKMIAREVAKWEGADAK